MPGVVPAWIAVAAAALLAGVALGAQIGRAHHHIVEHIDRQVNHLEGVIMTTTQDAINAVVEKLRHARQEIVARLAEVQAQLDDAAIPAEVVDLSALTDAAQALDDIVPDAPEVPAEVAGDPAES